MITITSNEQIEEFRKREKDFRQKYQLDNKSREEQKEILLNLIDKLDNDIEIAEKGMMMDIVMIIILSLCAISTAIIIIWRFLK